MKRRIKIDMWHGERFAAKQYRADAHFYPHGCFGYSYCGNIYNDAGKRIGDYMAADSQVVEELFLVNWK